jgi:ATP-dependent exoDNAse (exonuclease V) beta subunit
MPLSSAGLSVTLQQPGLLATPEVHLALACLRRLADPADTLASAEIVALKSSRTPEEWLVHRLEYLAAGNPSCRWGLTDTALEPGLLRLEGLRDRLELLSPAEVLDEVLAVADVRRDAKAWGPTLSRSAQRLANLETLRGLAIQYQDHCRTQRGSATVGGLLLWLYALADASLDLKGADGQADAVQVSTYHRAKGLEWPIVICMDLESRIQGRLWGVTALSEGEAVNLQAPLANRRLRYWPWPFAGLSKGVAVARRIAESAYGWTDERKQISEAVRLLYVSFTRARDLLILPLQKGAGARPWLDTLQADWLIPRESCLGLPDGGEVPCVTERLPVPLEMPPVRHDPVQNWFPVAGSPTRKMPAQRQPSTAPAVSGASIGRVIELGPSLVLAGRPDAEVLGEALHNILAADLIDPRNPGRKRMAAAAMQRFGLAEALGEDEVLECARRLHECLSTNFAPQALYVEWPVDGFFDNGQRLHGWIDLLVDTEAGWILVDHKSFPGSREEWPERALAYSGQLQAYKTAVQRATSRRVLSQWIHFPVSGGLVEVVLGGEAQQPHVEHTKRCPICADR